MAPTVTALRQVADTQWAGVMPMALRANNR